MADPQTPNIGLNIPTHGSDVGTWDASLNANANILDPKVAGTLTLFSTSIAGTVFLTPAQTLNSRIVISGALTQNISITLQASVSGGNYTVDNRTTGNFSVFVNTPTALLGRSAICAQGGRSVITSDGVNVDLGNDLLPTFTKAASIEFLMDGGGGPIQTGQKGYLELPFAFTVQQWTLVADVAGPITVDIWDTPYAFVTAFSSAKSITGSSQPALVNTQTAQSTALTGWNTALAAGDIMAFTVTATTSSTAAVPPTVPSRLTVSLRGVKS